MATLGNNPVSAVVLLEDVNLGAKVARPHDATRSLSEPIATDVFERAKLEQHLRAVLAAIEFVGSEGAFHSIELDGNDDIRDFNQSSYTNSINGTSATS